MKKENKVAKDFMATKEDNKQKKDVKKAKKTNAKPNIFKRIGGKFKDVHSELKKVNWPTFGKVVKQTGVVLVVVAIFLVVIGGFDTGLSELLKLIAPRS